MRFVRRNKQPTHGVSTTLHSRSIHQQILDDMDELMEQFIVAKRAGDDTTALRYEIRGMARTVGRFGWAGVSSYYHDEGTVAAEKQSMARVKEKLRAMRS